MNDLSDIDLILRIEKSEIRAFETLFDRYYSTMCRFALPILRHQDDCEVVASDVFLSLWKSRNTVKIHSSVKAYLLRATKNQALNYLASKKSKNHWLNFEENLSDDFVTEDDISSFDESLLNQLEKAIDALPPQCGLIFRMSKMEDLRYREIAEILGISEKTVENQIGKALKLVRLELQSNKVL